MKDNLINIFNGSEIEVVLLQGELEQSGIPSMTRNASASVTSTIYGGAPSALDLFINEPDLQKATPIIEEFIQNRDQEK